MVYIAVAGTLKELGCCHAILVKPATRKTCWNHLLIIYKILLAKLYAELERIEHYKGRIGIFSR